MPTSLARNRRAGAHPARRVHAASLIAGVLLGAPALAGSSGEWLASTDGPSPMVTSKSGVGTAQATATAKITSDSIKTLCAEEAGKGDPAKADAAIAACTKQLKPQLGKTYTVHADCTVGRLEPLDGKSYVLDGLWDNSDVGAGRTRWKGPDGVVGRDTASGGLALSQQWEVLCPGRVSASVISKARTLSPPAGAAASAAGGAAGAPAAPASVCGGDAACTEVNAFAMSVVEFRVSLQGAWKVVTTTLRFRNKLNRPLVLGYVLGSGGATDDRGNRYVVKDADVRGIGLVVPHQRADDKFVVSPGQTADARFTLVWSGQAIFGNTFDLDLTVREIAQVGNGQTTLGPEYPLQIVGLVDGARSAGPGVAQASGAAPAGASAPSTSSVPATTDAPAPPSPAPAQTGVASPFAIPAAAGGAHCAAGTSCHDAGSFSVTVTQTSAAMSGKNQVVRFALRVKNLTGQPLVLAYKAGTNAAVDERGNSYGWGRAGTHDGSAAGIGVVEAARIDPQFQVAPNGTRDAQMVLTRFDAGSKPAGKSFTLDTVLVELKGNGQQWQKVREHAVHLPAARAGVMPAVGQNPPGVTPTAAQNPANDQVQKAGDLLRGLLGGK